MKYRAKSSQVFNESDQKKLQQYYAIRPNIDALFKVI